MTCVRCGYVTSEPGPWCSPACEQADEGQVAREREEITRDIRRWEYEHGALPTPEEQAAWLVRPLTPLRQMRPPRVLRMVRNESA